MQTTTAGDLERHLDDLGLSRETDALIVHSSLISFGRIQFTAEELFGILRGRIAGNATIFAPAFTLNLTEGDVFDTARTPSHGMGVFSEYIRTLPGTVRADNPMHSYSGNGQQASVLESASGFLSFGPGSCFEKMLALDPYLLLLGCPFHRGATHIHQQEALTGVPYRKWLDLKRKVRSPGGEVQDIAFRYYGIDRALEVEWSPARVLEALKSGDKIREAGAPHGKSYLLRLSDLDFATRNVLEEDHNALNLLA